MKSLNPVLLPGDPSATTSAATKHYVDVRAVPAGGAVGQALVKVTATDYDYAWTDQSGTGGGAGPHGHVEGDITSLVTDLAALDGRLDTLEAAPPPVLDHGDLTGLADDDHPQYFDETRGDARWAALVHTHSYDPSGTAAAAISTHEAASDPHPGYLTQTEGDARYVLGSDGRLTNARTPTVHHATHAVGGSDDISADYVPWANVGSTGGVASYDDARLSDARTPTSHTHTIANVTGLQTALDGKEAVGVAAAAVTAHEAASDPHPQYLTDAEADAAYDTVGSATGAVDSHEAASDPHPGYLTPAEGDAAYAALSHAHSASDITSGTLAIARIPTGTSGTTVALGNDSRFTNARTPTAHASTHATAGSDPIAPADIGASASGHTHSGVYEPAGAVATHEAASDPHPGYLTQAEGDARYPALSHTHSIANVTGLQTALDGKEETGVAATLVGAHEAASNPHPGYLTQTEGDALYSVLAHTHAASGITSGTLAIARIPTGTSGTTVALGNDSRFTDARTPTSHVHAAADVSSGTLAFARIPTGTTSTTVAIGDHTHSGLGGGGGGFAAGVVPSSSATPTITHGLGTRDIIVSVREVSTNLIVRVATETPDDNTVTFTFTTTPTSGQYRYTVLSAAATLGTGAHSHAEVDVTGLQADLDDKSDVGHTHAEADITSLVTDLAGKSATSHVHDYSLVYAAIDHNHDASYSALGHTHSLASLGAAASTHSHAATDVTSGTLAFARIPTGTTSSTVAIGNHGHAGSDISSGTVAYARLPVGTAVSTVAAGDDSRIIGAVPSTRQVIAGTGLTGGGALSADRTLTVAYGTTSTTAAVGNDSRLSDARTPTAHAASHATGGGDAVTPAAIGASATGHTHTAALVPFAPVGLTDAATIATDASAGNHFRVTLTTNRILGNPTSATDGQRVLWELAGGASDRVLTLGSEFEKTSGIDAVLTIPASKVAWLSAVRNTSRSKWTVMGWDWTQ
jgi:hypothetical protein